jgi:hypothetical protein
VPRFLEVTDEGSARAALDIPEALTTFTVAASNTPAGREANYRCTGTNDQNIINQAIIDLPSTGGKVKLLVGQYNISSPVIIDRSYVDLEGESHMMWGGYRTSYGNETGVEGFAGAKLKATANGIDLILLDNNNIPDNGENRHRGIRIAFLYLFGSNYTGSGVKFQTGAQHDIVHMSNLTCHRLRYGIFCGGDASFIHHNNVQDCVDGIVYLGGNGQITNNIVWDCSGSGLIIQATSLAPIIAADNNIGNCAVDGIEARGPVVINGNEIVHCKDNQIWLRAVGDAGGNAAVSGNVLRTNTSTPVATGIKVDTPGNAISGNTLNATASTTGAAIDIGGTVVDCSVGNNVIVGAWADPPVTIGLSNVVESNSGFTTVGSGGRVIVDGGVIPHGLPKEPTTVILSGTVAGEIVTVTDKDETNITVAIKTNAGGVGSVQKVYWRASVENELIVGPAEISTGVLVGWYKADDLDLDDDDSVTAWPDASTVDVELEPRTAAPTFKTNIIGGKPVVRFNGSSTAMISTLFPIVSLPLTIFVVAKQTTGGTAQNFVAARNGGGLSQTLSAYLSSGGAPSGYAGAPTATGPTVTTTSAHVYEWVFAEPSKAGANGVVNSGDFPASRLGGGITIGANGNVTPSEYFNGDIAEVLVYGGNVSDTDRTAIREALGTKYGIDVTPGS